MWFKSLFSNTNKFDISKFPLDIAPEGVSEGPACLLLSKENGILKVMYNTADVMEGETLNFDKLFSKYGYQKSFYSSFDGWVLIGEVKGHIFNTEEVLDFGKINGLR